MGLFGGDSTSLAVQETFITDQSKSFSQADQGQGTQLGSKLLVGEASGAEFNITADPLSINMAKEIALSAVSESASAARTAISSARASEDAAFELASKASETDTSKVFSGFKGLLWPVAIVVGLLVLIFKFGGKS